MKRAAMVLESFLTATGAAADDRETAQPPAEWSGAWGLDPEASSAALARDGWQFLGMSAMSLAGRAPSGGDPVALGARRFRPLLRLFRRGDAADRRQVRALGDGAIVRYCFREESHDMSLDVHKTSAWQQ